MTLLNNVLATVPFGVEVCVNNFMCVQKKWAQVKFPKSKKVRIRKKWRKNSKYYAVIDVHTCYKVGNKLFVSSKDFEVFKKLPLALKLTLSVQAFFGINGDASLHRW